jgi:hypothetical protein
MRRAIAALGAAMVVIVASSAAIAAAASSPSVSLDRSSVTVGDRIVVTLHDWPQRGAVVISVCGNLARRGSVDCNLADSQGMPMTPYVPPVTELVVKAPPTTCPCVIRAANSTQDIVAYTPIAIAGLPIGPVVGAVVESPLALEVTVHRAHAGVLPWLRSSLGGPTAYDVIVVVRNKSAEDLPGIRLLARAGRSAHDQARIIEITAPPNLAAGTSWTHTERVTIAAPVVGRFVWTISASGAGPSVTDEAGSHQVPLLLLLLIAAVAGVVTSMIVRWVRRRFPNRATNNEDEPLESDGRSHAATLDADSVMSPA